MKVKVDGHEVDLRRVVKSLNEEQMAFVIETYVNSFGLEGAATRIGEHLCNIHRALQHNVVGLCLGILRGLSTNPYTDTRNATAIATARKITRLRDAGELRTGPAT